MFGFLRRKSRADAANEVMDDAIRQVTERWLYFCSTLPLKAEVSLTDWIAAFASPMMEGLQQNFPSLRGSPEGVLLVFVAKGIERSGTHPAAEIYEALGMPPMPG